VKAFEAEYGTLSSYGPLAYEGANILLTAIQKAGPTHEINRRSRWP
jgi:hypothetical protein